MECYDSLWNVTIACGMLQDATCSLRSHWLARCARTGLFLRKMHENLIKIYGNLGNLRKCKKIDENLMKIYGHLENLTKCKKIYENLLKTDGNLGNLTKCKKMLENLLKIYWNLKKFNKM